MTTPQARAGRALARLRRSYTITCQVCGQQAIMQGPAAKVCRKRACRQVMDTKRRRIARQNRKEAQQ